MKFRPLHDRIVEAGAGRRAIDIRSERDIVCARAAHGAAVAGAGMTMRFDRADYSAVVKNRASLPSSWKWEIYRAGRSSPIKQSLVYFQSMVAAHRAGKEALKQLLDKLCAKPSQTPL